MRFIYLLLLAGFVVISSDTIAAFAVMNEEIDSGETVNTVIYERQKSQNEYEIYRRDKQIKEAVAAPAETSVVVKKDTIYSNTNNDIIIGVGLLLIAISLTIYLYISSNKNKRENNNETFKEGR